MWGSFSITALRWHKRGVPFLFLRLYILLFVFWNFYEWQQRFYIEKAGSDGSYIEWILATNAYWFALDNWGWVFVTPIFFAAVILIVLEVIRIMREAVQKEKQKKKHRRGRPRR